MGVELMIMLDALRLEIRALSLKEETERKEMRKNADWLADKVIDKIDLSM